MYISCYFILSILLYYCFIHPRTPKSSVVRTLLRQPKLALSHRSSLFSLSYHLPVVCREFWNESSVYITSNSLVLPSDVGYSSVSSVSGSSSARTLMGSPGSFNSPPRDMNRDLVDWLIVEVVIQNLGLHFESFTESGLYSRRPTPFSSCATRAPHEMFLILFEECCARKTASWDQTQGYFICP